MPASLIDAESLLAVDVGTVTTQATLFDVVEGCYRFIAAGQAPTTALVPFRNISEGVHRAIESLQTITGRTFLGSDHKIITPVRKARGLAVLLPPFPPARQSIPWWLACWTMSR